MKKIEIDVAVNKKVVQVVSKTISINLPSTHAFYRKVDDGCFFPEGIMLFAIILKYPGCFTKFTLVKVTRNNQVSTDFHIEKDCNDEYWLTDNSIRKVAYKILSTSYSDHWQIITNDEFEKERLELLNNYFNDIEYFNSKEND